MFAPKNEISILQKAIADKAYSYLGKLTHAPTNASYISTDISFGSVANDFMLLLCDSLGDIPEPVQQEVWRRYVHTKNSNALFQAETALRMCCWEFCFLVLFEVELVDKKTIDTLCRIVYARKEENITLAHAFCPDTLNNDSLVTIHNPVQTGDMVLYRKKNQTRAWHAAIALNSQTIVELVGGPVRLESPYSYHENEIHRISAQDLEENIRIFIEKNASFSRSCIRENSAELEVLLKNSQYFNLYQTLFLNEMKQKYPQSHFIYQKVTGMAAERRIFYPTVIQLSRELNINYTIINDYRLFGELYSKIIEQCMNEPAGIDIMKIADQITLNILSLLIPDEHAAINRNPAIIQVFKKWLEFVAELPLQGDRENLDLDLITACQYLSQYSGEAFHLNGISSETPNFCKIL